MDGITADIRKNDLGYYRAKFKKFLTTEDHIKRADSFSLGKKILGFKKNVKIFTRR